MSHWLSRLTRPVPLPNWFADFLVLIPRLVCGYLLTKEFGAPKFGLPWSPPDNNLRLFEVAFWFPQDVRNFGGVFALAPGLFAWLGAFSEGVGGIALLIGLQTRLFGLLVAGTMLVAIFGQQWGNGMWQMLPALGFLWFGLYSVVLGAGRLSVDHLLTSRRAP
ncbi:MAG TPA: DoxX family protein [Gemmatimonas sp.]|nr:DoxX family protein [Gemmatimonas sp.]